MQLPQCAPVTLKRAKEPFDHPDWLFELKYDGFRALAFVGDKTPRLVSRRGNTFRRFTAVAEGIASEFRGSAILDGEIVCLDAEGRSQFDQLFFRRDTPCFVAFDLLWLNGQDLRRLPLISRKAALREIVPAQSSVLLCSDFVREHGRELFRVVCESDLEGIVAKPQTSLYTPEQSTWIKIKNPNYSQGKDRQERFEKLHER